MPAISIPILVQIYKHFRQQNYFLCLSPVSLKLNPDFPGLPDSIVSNKQYLYVLLAI